MTTKDYSSSTLQQTANITPQVIGYQMIDPEKIIWRADLPALFKKSDETIRRWIRDGKLPKPDVELTQQSRGWKVRTLHEAGIKV